MTLDDDSQTRDQVLALEDARFAAMIGGREDDLERLFVDDAVYTHSSGIVHDKAGYIQAMRDREFAYTSIQRSETDAAFAGGAVLLTGRIKLDAVFKTGPHTLDCRFLSVWVKADGHWRFLAWQSTPVPA
jgi:hypothetical protein